MIDSDAFLDREQLPRRVCFIGAGYISMEFAHAAARAGVEVTIVEQGDRVLGDADEQLSEAAARASRAAGIELHCGVTVGGVEATPTGLRICGEHRQGIAEVDLVVHGAERVPNVDGLGLEQAEVEVDGRGVVIADLPIDALRRPMYAYPTLASNLDSMLPTL